MLSRLDGVRVLSKQILVIQHMLAKIDRLHLPLLSRLDIERILCRQISRFLETSMPCHAGHGERTASYSLRLGQAVGLLSAELHQLALAALLHDIGLLALPPRVFSTFDSPLEADDYALVQSHPRTGAELLQPYGFLRSSALLIAHHHERWDGYGYPYGLQGDFIPVGSRILAIADTFDAIVSRRRWLGSLAEESGWAELRILGGTQLDPSLVATFCALEHELKSQTKASLPFDLAGAG
jgi:response regulator RpfG family c-di-GMP phosphodiesterase